MTHIRNQQAVDHFDMLPFIAIMMCTLGGLLLVAMSMAALNLGHAGEKWLVCGDQKSCDSITKKPILAEWDGKQVIFHQPNGKVSVTWERSTCTFDKKSYDRYIDPNFSARIDDFNIDSDSQYVLIAVRPSGFDTFMEFSDEFRCRGIAVGYEPIQQDRNVKLGLSN